MRNHIVKCEKHVIDQGTTDCIEKFAPDNDTQGG